jgi:hypothetical protein
MSLRVVQDDERILALGRSIEPENEAVSAIGVSQQKSPRVAARGDADARIGAAVGPGSVSPNPYAPINPLTKPERSPVRYLLVMKICTGNLVHERDGTGEGGGSGLSPFGRTKVPLLWA